MNDFLRASIEDAMASGQYPESSRFRIEEVTALFESAIDDFEDEHGERPVLDSREQCDGFVEEWMDYVLEDLVFIDEMLSETLKKAAIPAGILLVGIFAAVVFL